MVEEFTQHTLLRRTFALAGEARANGDHPFGALLAVDGVVVAESLNRVNSDTDVSSHAELMLVRIMQREGKLELLSAGVVYASCEPCPMCVGALFWAGARHVIFGLSAARLTTLSTKPGSDPFAFTMTAQEIGARATPELRVEGPFSEDEAAESHLDFWISP
jgi:tRNA(Arg) A34 adenosine deaminase TadA